MRVFARLGELNAFAGGHGLGDAHIGDLGGQRPCQQHIAALHVQVQDLRRAATSLVGG